MKLAALWAAVVILLSTPNQATAQSVVKMSSSKICHDTSSQYYERVKRFQSFGTLAECLNAGGRLPKGSKSTAMPVHTASAQQTPKTSSAYKREYFGRGWADEDRDCQNTRHEVLAAQSTGPVRFKTGRECRVVAGRWISPFTGEVIHDPSKMDIDHVVPLKWAWVHGADRWSKSKREKFANDPANLLSVEASLNRQKGADGPDKWLPPANQCQYVLRFLRVAKSYQLNVPAHYQQVRESVCKK